MQELRHNCGISVAHSLHDVYSMIKSLQHRGRDAAGIAMFRNDGGIDAIKWIGSVNTFDLKDLTSLFPAEMYHTYMAHVRYATRGRKEKEQILNDAHPHFIGGEVHKNGDHLMVYGADAAIVHNGQVDIDLLEGIDRSKLKTGCDSEALLHYYMQNGPNRLLRDIPGAYVTAIMSKNDNNTIVLRDPHENRIGALGVKDGKYCVASEDVAFKENGATLEKYIDGGSVYRITPNGAYEVEKVVSNRQKQTCCVEWTYISSIDSSPEGVSVHKLRRTLGKKLIEEYPDLGGDFVTYVPRCPEHAAKAIAEELNLPLYKLMYKKNAKRVFMGPKQKKRKKSAKKEILIDPRINVRGLRGLFVEDSVIRGTNSTATMEKVDEEAAPSEKSLASYSPMIGVYDENGEGCGCSYGVDMPPNDNFIVREFDEKRNKTKDEMAREIGVERLEFLSRCKMLDGFEEVGIPRENLCTRCMGGRKPF